MPMTPEEISAGLKAKYPQYKDVPDEVLLPKLFEKHPVYQKLLTTTPNAQETSQVPEDDFLRRQVPAKLAQSTNLSAQAIGKILSNLPYQDYGKPTTPEKMTDVVMNASPMGMAGSVGKAVRSGLETHLLGILKQNLPGKNQALIALAEKNPVQALKSGLNVKDWPKIDKWINEFKNLGHEGPELEALVNNKAKGLIDEVNSVGLEAPKAPSTTSNAEQTIQRLKQGNSEREKMITEDLVQVKAKTQGQPPVSMEGWQVLGKGEGITSYASPEGVRVDIPDGIEPGQFLNMVREAESLRGGKSPIPKGLTPAQEKVKLNKELAKTPNADPFFLKTAKVLEEKGIPESMPSKGLLNLLLKKQVKPDEIKWSGLDKFLEGKERVTKAEVQQYIKENDFHVNEIEKGGKTLHTYKVVGPDGIVEQGFESKEVANNFADEFAAQRNADPSEYKVQKETIFSNDNPVEFGPETHPDLVIHGATRHEETLYQLPINTSADAHITIQEISKGPIGGGSWVTFSNGRRRVYYGTKKEIEMAAQKDIDNGLSGSSPTQEFQGGHYNEPNVLAHVLRDEIKIGKDKVSLLNEKQSDWHQQGGKEGYKTGIEEKAKQLVETWKNTKGPSYLKNTEIRALAPDDFVKVNAPNEVVSAMYQFVKGEKGVPDGPFKKNWNLLIDKREIRRAVERKQDGLAWPAGEVIADRYNLAKHVDEVQVNVRPGQSTKNMHEDSFLVRTFKNGNELISRDITLEELPNFLGKDLAAKIQKDYEIGTLPEIERHTTGKIKDTKSYTGVDLTIGGQWHKKMYDQKFVDDLNAFVKPFGAKMERVEYKPTSIRKLSNAHKGDLIDSLNTLINDPSAMDYTEFKHNIGQYGYKIDEELFEAWYDTNRDPYTRLTATQMFRDLQRHQVEKTIPMWYLKFTPALKRAALKEGFPLFTGLGALGLVGKEASSNEKK